MKKIILISIALIAFTLIIVPVFTFAQVDDGFAVPVRDEWEAGGMNGGDSTAVQVQFGMEDNGGMNILDETAVPVQTNEDEFEMKTINPSDIETWGEPDPGTMKTVGSSEMIIWGDPGGTGPMNSNGADTNTKLQVLNEDSVGWVGAGSEIMKSTMTDEDECMKTSEAQEGKIVFQIDDGI